MRRAAWTDAHLIEGRVQLVPCPVLVLRGENDPSVSDTWCRTLAARAPDGGGYSIARGALVVQHNRAREVSAAVLAFATEGTQIAR